MIKKPKQRTFDEAVTNLRDHQFDVQPVPADASTPPAADHADTAGAEVMVRKNGCAALLLKQPDGFATLTAQPGILLGGQIARILDRGYQKFLKTSTLEVPATAAQLKAVHEFTAELKYATGEISFYNQSLGTVSDRYQYDRVKGRDLPESQRPVPAWELPPRSH